MQILGLPTIVLLCTSSYVNLFLLHSSVQLNIICRLTIQMSGLEIFNPEGCYDHALFSSDDACDNVLALTVDNGIVKWASSLSNETIKDEIDRLRAIQNRSTDQQNQLDILYYLLSFDMKSNPYQNIKECEKATNQRVELLHAETCNIMQPILKEKERAELRRQQYLKSSEFDVIVLYSSCCCVT